VTSERRECFCGRRTVFEFGLTDDDGNAHTWRSCGKDEDGQGLDVNTLLSERMEQVERAEKAEAARDRLANQLLNEVPDSYIQMKARALDAEAAIQRVREVCDLWQRRHDASIRHPTDIPAVAIVAVRRALDGER